MCVRNRFLFLTAVWFDTGLRVPVPWCHENTELPALRRQDEEERNDRRGTNPVVVRQARLRRQRHPLLRSWRRGCAGLPRLAAVQENATGCVGPRPDAQAQQWARLEPVAAVPDGRAGPRRGAPRRPSTPGRNAVVLIAYGDGHVLGWYVARSETSAAWENLMARIAEPVVAV